MQLQRAMSNLCAIGGTTPRSVSSDLPDGPVHHLELDGPGSSTLPRQSPPEPIVLIHGAGGGAANWYHMFAPLSRTHRVLAVDLPGFGLTDARPLQPPLGTQAARFIRDWMDQIGLA